MVNWNNIQNATTADEKPTPGWLFNEIILDLRNSPKDCPDVAEYLMQCVCSDQLNVQLKAVLTMKHLASEDITFQQYMQSCPGALKVLEDIAAPPIVPQARALEPQEVKTVRDATAAAISAVHTPHTVEKSTEKMSLKEKCQGFGNFEPPPEAKDEKGKGVKDQVVDFVADSIGDMADDFRQKGAVGALKDATVDALDLVLDGVDTIWGWVAGKNANEAPRICQPVGAVPGSGMQPGANFAMSQGGAAAPAGFAPPVQSKSSANPYAAAFGGGVVGANNPVSVGGFEAPAPAPQAAPAPAPAPPPPAPKPAPVVDLLSMDEPAPAASPATTADLLGDMSAPAPSQTSLNMLDL
mmetsp:Transcript_27887/g.59037  ORF Transcript_27887/g.59037 Transcript_27887/m.59037 type:complete len:353 (-) Transcript_27887:157-1215(-)